MPLTAVHLRLTYRCVHECDHCAHWGAPWQDAAMTRIEVMRVLDDASEIASVESIRFEGGEPFLYYPILLEGIRAARARGFRVEVSTSGSWASDPAAAIEWLAPLASSGVQWIGIHDDRFRPPAPGPDRTALAMGAAEILGIPCFVERCGPPTTRAGGMETDRSLLLRGRAADGLEGRVAPAGPEALDRCGHEDLRSPRRVHVDPYGLVLLCPGIAIGSLYWDTLRGVMEQYAPDRDPVLAPLLRGGPEALARELGVELPAGEASACQACYRVREALRERFPDRLGPPAVYGARGRAFA